MNHINIQYHATAHGELVLGSFKDRLCLCDWRYRKKRAAVDNRLAKALGADFRTKDTEVLAKTRQQLEEYLTYKRKTFDILLMMVGTDFQKKVWQALTRIPFGSTISYQHLAESIGSKEAIRAVAGANGANAISIIIPCHRVIGKNGQLVGYAGGLRAKAALLRLEQSLINR